MADIVERLRGREDDFGFYEEAADEIERLRQQNAALLASLDKYKEWFPKLIEGGTFPGESDDLRQQNAALLAALQGILAIEKYGFGDSRHIPDPFDIARAAIEANKKAAPCEAAHTRD